jgi:hypothetical protein
MKNNTRTSSFRKLHIPKPSKTKKRPFSAEPQNANFLWIQQKLKEDTFVNS